jgi:outer membrane protein OmpA-like peptidoglycan-associated protein
MSTAPAEPDVHEDTQMVRTATINTALVAVLLFVLPAGRLMADEQSNSLQQLPSATGDMAMLFDCPPTDIDRHCSSSPFDYIGLSKIRFNHGESELTSAARAALDSDVIYLHLHADSVRRILITGHADDIGTVAYNENLSLKRAQAVRDYLIERGIPARLLRLRYAGEIQPLDESWNNRGRAHNRRVGLYVLKSRTQP